MSITTTDARRRTVGFTNGYDFGYFSLVVPDGSPITGFSEMAAGQRIGVVQGAVQEAYVVDTLHLDPVKFIVMWTRRAEVGPVVGWSGAGAAAKQGGVVGSVALVGEGGSPVQPASRFLQHLLDAGNSPNTAAAYGYDLPYLFEFFAERGLDWREFRPAIAFDLLGWPLGASAGGDRAVRDGRHAHPARGRQRW